MTHATGHIICKQTARNLAEGRIDMNISNNQPNWFYKTCRKTNSSLFSVNWM